MCSKYSISVERALSPVACPGIRKGGGDENLKGFFFLCFSIFQGRVQLRKYQIKLYFQARVQEFVRGGGGQNLKGFFFFFFFFNFLGGNDIFDKESSKI